ncbi:LacI family DNA-binding transcriptional regulator [Rhizobium sp. KVB221]|uniref:LacI family DNA-binding transcriptional regulator n=1 Tax=Rhizobium setariae TaxID=2801340 RepID=A0A937CNX5_9HYPH|nr:LacI family DNA-binding transcriptional regulator [Rhizobium setariae]MBL0371738.1 LacI family DNA-binding transcriptional regulator [Rhizobium setariae]
MRPTVHDIAEAAGVSLATVDRVLNRRPGVRTQTRAKVEDAIARIGFIRDMAAANLAKSRIYPLVFIVPQGENSFMAGLRSEVEAAAGRSMQERIAIRLIDVPAFDAAALVKCLESLLEIPPAGVAVVAVDAPEVHAAIERLRETGTIVVTLVSDLPAALRDHFAGVDNVAAGRTAGRLMGRFLAGRQGKVAVIAGSMLVGDHRDRLEGFRERLHDIAPSLQILPVMESHDDPNAAHALVADTLSDHPNLAGIYNLGAGNRGLVKALEARRHAAGVPVTIVHELTPFTREALQTGLIDAVLNQDAGHEVRSAIRVLKARIDGQPVVAAQERIRIDIFLKDNLP